ncbi:sec-independent protein translocase protein TATB, chloroplastic isoform X2 [Cynara cardunculus var. scolymus]|uniref:sec-independent protein translocase protein TATB, chloroplastic isoform X2 n=1 Tax=Cynara cardunculus var. scolymus TaxID=59895 RepID=UPI000D62870C|nr:sec-independent protein translocase protein TATB, chloroplastic isoform X2 [Cynara cardunculus var. scolymus]
MASATLVPPYSSHTSPPLPKVSKSSPFLASLSTSPISFSKKPIFRSLTLVPQQGLASFSTWNGLRQNGFSISLKSLRFEKRRKHGGKGVYASLFGVGAPEALVIGVVALLVFGPKGLAEIAKNLGKTLRAFQPTIRELQEVSREFKSTLEKEIGLDELQNTARGTTSNVPTLSSTPPSENSLATPKETAAAATEEDSQVTGTPIAASGQDAQVSETPGEDSQVAATPVAADGKDAQVSETPGEDSQVAATPVAATTNAATTGDSEAVATTPAATTSDSQPTIKSNSVEEVGAGMHLAQKSEDVN